MIIFFILLTGGLVFYARISSYTSTQQQEENQKLNAMSIEQRIRHLSEISCTNDAVVIFDCYDLSKIHALQQIIPYHTPYYQSVIFKNARVTITSVYPTQDQILLFEPVETRNSVRNQPFRTPVTLYDPLSDTTNFGYITAEVYS